MKHQQQTIREFIESAHEGEWASYVDRDAALTALSELERMAGEQEPVAWAVYWGLPPTRKNSVHFDKESAQAVANQIKSATEVRPLYAAPPAQHAAIERKDALLRQCLKHVASNISMTSDGTEAEDLYDAITKELQ